MNYESVYSLFESNDISCDTHSYQLPVLCTATLHIITASGENLDQHLIPLMRTGFLEIIPLHNVTGRCFLLLANDMPDTEVVLVVAMFEMESENAQQICETLYNMCISILSSNKDFFTINKGKLIALLGIDGSGKSTQLDRLKSSLALSLIGTRFTYGGNNNYSYKWLNKLKETQKAGGRINPIKRRLAGYVAAYDRRRRVKVACDWIKRGHIVIFDRYFYDDMIYFEKMKLEGKKLNKIKTLKRRLLSARLGRIPDKTYYLDIDAATSFKRKHEHDIQTLETTITAYKNLLAGRSEVVFLDAKELPHKLTELILNGICEGEVK